MFRETLPTDTTEYVCCSKPCDWIWIQRLSNKVFSRLRYSRPWVSFEIYHRAHNCLCYSLFRIFQKCLHTTKKYVKYNSCKLKMTRNGYHMDASSATHCFPLSQPDSGVHCSSTIVSPIIPVAGSILCSAWIGMRRRKYGRHLTEVARGHRRCWLCLPHLPRRGSLS